MEEETPTLWKVVGGKVSSGVWVREGLDLKSARCGGLLAHGAIVEELEFTNKRLRYLLISGGGPRTGWVSVECSQRTGTGSNAASSSPKKCTLLERLPSHDKGQTQEKKKNSSNNNKNTSNNDNNNNTKQDKQAEAEAAQQKETENLYQATGNSTPPDDPAKQKKKPGNSHQATGKSSPLDDPAMLLPTVESRVPEETPAVRTKLMARSISPGATSDFCARQMVDTSCKDEGCWKRLDETRRDHPNVDDAGAKLDSAAELQDEEKQDEKVQLLVKEDREQCTDSLSPSTNPGTTSDDVGTVVAREEGSRSASSTPGAIPACRAEPASSTSESSGSASTCDEPRSSSTSSCSSSSPPSSSSAPCSPPPSPTSFLSLDSIGTLRGRCLACCTKGPDVPTSAGLGPCQAWQTTSKGRQLIPWRHPQIGSGPSPSSPSFLDAVSSPSPSWTAPANRAGPGLNRPSSSDQARPATAAVAAATEAAGAAAAATTTATTTTAAAALAAASADASPSCCSRCGCSASCHEDLSSWKSKVQSAIRRFRHTGATTRRLPPSFCQLSEETLDWDIDEVALFVLSGGRFKPRSRSGNPQPGLVSVCVPTSTRRHIFHPLLYENFKRQKYEPKELVVVDTGKSASAFLEEIARKDRRVHYFHFDVHDAKQDRLSSGQPRSSTANYEPSSNLWSLGLKRNIAAALALGEAIAHFDDDDLYAPEYLEYMRDQLVAEVRKRHGHLDPPASVSRDKIRDAQDRTFRSAAAIVTLREWHLFDFSSLEFRHLHPETDPGVLQSWKKAMVYGYGFSYLYTSKAWHLEAFPDTEDCEDDVFMARLRDQHRAAVRLASLPGNPAAALVAHTFHTDNTGVSEFNGKKRLGTVVSTPPQLGDLLPIVQEIRPKVPRPQLPLLQWQLQSHLTSRSAIGQTRGWIRGKGQGKGSHKPATSTSSVGQVKVPGLPFTTSVALSGKARLQQYQQPFWAERPPPQHWIGAA